MKSNKKVPIERINKFFSQDDFDLEVDFGREWLEGDINIKVILYQVDRTETTNDDIYAVRGGGGTSGGRTNVIDRVTIQTAGNASDFGDLLAGNQGLRASSGAAS